MDDTFRLEIWEGLEGWFYTVAATLLAALFSLSFDSPEVRTVLHSLAFIPQFVYHAMRNRPGTLLLQAATWLVLTAAWTGGLAALAGGGVAAFYPRGTDGVAAVQGSLRGLPVALPDPVAAGGRELTLLFTTSLLSAGTVGLNLLLVRLNSAAIAVGLVLRHAAPGAIVPWGLLPHLGLQAVGGLLLVLAGGLLSVRVMFRQPVPWLAAGALFLGGAAAAAAGVALEWSLAPAGLAALRQSLAGVELLS